jgi:hypothetical protein
MMEIVLTLLLLTGPSAGHDYEIRIPSPARIHSHCVPMAESFYEPGAALELSKRIAPDVVVVIDARCSYREHA